MTESSKVVSAEKSRLRHMRLTCCLICSVIGMLLWLRCGSERRVQGPQTSIEGPLVFPADADLIGVHARRGNDEQSWVHLDSETGKRVLRALRENRSSVSSNPECFLGIPTAYEVRVTFSGSREVVVPLTSNLLVIEDPKVLSNGIDRAPHPARYAVNERGAQELRKIFSELP